MVLTLYTWERHPNEIARRETPGTFDTIEVREHDVALRYSNGVFKEQISGGQKTKWNPLSHDEVVWITLQPFEIKNKQFTITNPYSTQIEIYAQLKVKEPRTFASEMVKAGRVMVSEIEIWLSHILTTILLEFQSKGNTKKSLTELKSRAEKESDKIGLELLDLVPPQQIFSQKMIDAKEDLNVAPLKRDNFSTRIEAILSALEKVQKPEQEIRLKAIEAFKEWANKSDTNITLAQGMPFGIPSQNMSDGFILKQLVNYFERDTGSSEIVYALKEILTDSDYMGLHKNETQNQSIVFNKSEFETSLINFLKLNQDENYDYEISISSFKFMNNLYIVKGEVFYASEEDKKARQEITNAIDKNEKKKRTFFNKNKLDYERKKILFSATLQPIRSFVFTSEYNPKIKTIISYDHHLRLG